MNDETPQARLVSRRGRPPVDERKCSVTTNVPLRLFESLRQLAQKNREPLSVTVCRQLAKTVR